MLRPLAALACLPLLASAAQEEPSSAPLRVLVVTGENNHHWEFTSRKLVELLYASGKFRVDRTETPAQTLADAAGLAEYDALVLDYNGPRWGAEAEAAFVAAVRGGTGVVVVHAADNAFPGWTEYEELVGHLWRDGTGHGRFHPFDVEVTDADHPVTRGLAPILGHDDELYHRLVNPQGVEDRVLMDALSTKESDGTGRREPVVMAHTFGEGRVFHTTLGHVWRGSQFSRESYKDPRFQDLIVRGTEWAASGEVTTQRTPPNALSELERAQGWQLLFDGETLAGWRGYGLEGAPEGWIVRDGALVVTGGGGVDLITEQQYGDFDLDFEFKVSERANSGVMYRVTERSDPSWHTGPEYQVLDDALLGELPNLKHSVGAIYDLVAPEVKVARLPGHWNRARISVRGWRVQHYLNGHLTAEADLHSPMGARLVAASKFARMDHFAQAREGHLALQDHGDEVAYRSLKLFDRSSHPGVALLADGLTGWTSVLAAEGGQAEGASAGAEVRATPADQAGAVWSLEDGMLVCDGSRAGFLRTDREYRDFALRFSWRWDGRDQSGGESGVLLRAGGEDRLWPRALEVRLDTGSAGDLVALGGFPLRPDPARTRGQRTAATHHPEGEVGEWSTCAIVFEGDQVSVYVNDELVNEAHAALEVPGRIAFGSRRGELHVRDVTLSNL